MSIGKNIKALREKKGWTQAELATRLGVSDKTVSSWEIDRTEPKMGKVEALALVLGCLKTDIIGEDAAIKKNKPNTTTAVRIPVYGNVAAGIPLEMITDIVDWEELPAAMLSSDSEFFALRIHGDSMEPRMKDGDVVIVRKQNDAETGDVVIAAVNGDSATCKRLRKLREGIELIPSNPSYEPFYFSNQEIIEKPVTILGKVVELRAKF